MSDMVVTIFLLGCIASAALLSWLWKRRAVLAAVALAGGIAYLASVGYLIATEWPSEPVPEVCHGWDDDCGTFTDDPLAATAPGPQEIGILNDMSGSMGSLVHDLFLLPSYDACMTSCVRRMTR